MKTVRIEISRKEYSTITVLVPDDFDAGRLHHWAYGKAVRAAAESLDPEWDRDLAVEVEVEGIEVLTGDDALKELREYEAADLTADLARCEAEMVALMNRAKDRLAAKAGRPVTEGNQ